MSQELDDQECQFLSLADNFQHLLPPIPRGVLLRWSAKPEPSRRISVRESSPRTKSQPKAVGRKQTVEVTKDKDGLLMITDINNKILNAATLESI